MLGDEELTKRFQTHHTSLEQSRNISEIKEVFLELAGMIDDRVPDSREKSLAITQLEEASFWATAGVARHSDPGLV